MRVTLPQGGYTAYGYDTRGNITSTTQVPSTGSGTITTSAAYPALTDPACYTPVICNRPISTTDARGAVTNYEWNTISGVLVRATQPAPTTGAARPETRYGYSSLYAWYRDSSGTIVQAATPVQVLTGVTACITGAGNACAGTANEVATVLTYAAGSSTTPSNLRLDNITSGAGNNSLTAVTYYTWTPDGDVASVTDPLGAVVRYSYDDGRQLVGVVGPDPDGAGPRLNRARRITYNDRGQPTLTEAGTRPGYTGTFTPLQAQRTTYGAYGRPTQATAEGPTGTVYALSQFSYDAAGRLNCAAQRLNPSQYASLPTPDCTVAAPVAGYGPDRFVRTTFDAAGRAVSTTTGNGTAAAITQSVTYTDDGLPASLTDGNGNVSSLTYDGFDRPYRLYYPNPSTGAASTTDYQEWGYDLSTGTTTVRDRANTVFTTYIDALNRPTAYTASTLPTRTFTYDNLGRPLSVTTTSSTPVWGFTWTWDALGRRLTETSAQFGTLTSGYDLAGRRNLLTWPDGVCVAYGHDAYGELLYATTAPTGCTSFTNVAAYAWDDLGRLTGLTRGNETSAAWAYDAVSRLTGLTQDAAGTTGDIAITLAPNPAAQTVDRTLSNPAYQYPAVGGLNAYTNDRLNRVTATTYSPTITYDARSNITSANGWTYTYDAEGNLATATKAGVTFTFVTDPLRRLYSESSGGTRFLYDGAQVVAEYDASGNVTARHVPGLGLDDLAVSYSGGGTSTPSFPLTDERGSVIAQTNASGTVTATNTYDEYGYPYYADTGRFQYTGQLRLPGATALYNYRTRAYDADLGRFLQPDTAGYQAGLNLYAYVGGDPVNAIDPWGESQCDATVPLPTPIIGAYKIVCVSRDGDESPFGVGGIGIPRGPGLGGAGGPGISPQVGGADAASPAQCPVVLPGPVGSTGQDTLAAELALSGRPDIAIDAFNISRQADDAARAEYPGMSTRGTPSDAFRHLYGSFELTRRFGVGLARDITNSHEVYSPNLPQDRAMDVYNNAMARMVASLPMFRNMNARQAARWIISHGCARINSPR